MQEQKFWSIINATRDTTSNKLEARIGALEQQLSRLSLEEIQGFQRQYDQMIHRANRWDLLGAAYLMNGGCSDDGFRYFCHWLISEGQATFEQALVEPDFLAESPRQEYFELESFGYVALGVFARKGGGELARDFTIELTMPTGKEWFEDELQSLFPKLATKYGA